MTIVISKGAFSLKSWRKRDAVIKNDKLHRLDTVVNSHGGHSSGKAGDWICTGRADGCIACAQACSYFLPQSSSRDVGGI